MWVAMGSAMVAAAQKAEVVAGGLLVSTVFYEG